MEAEKLKYCYEYIFSLKEGEIVLKDILSRAGVDFSAFEVDPYKTAFKCGMQEMALIIKSLSLPEKKKVDEEAIT